MEKQNNKSTIQRIRDSFRTPLALIIACLSIPTILVGAIIVIVLFQNNLDTEPRLRIDNLAEIIPGFPSDTRQFLEQELYNHVKSSATDQDVPTSGALIRSDTLYSFDIANSFFAGDFIVDIATMQQSYIIKYFYGSLDSLEAEPEFSASVQIFCVENPEQIIYENFNCISTDEFSRSDPIHFLLPQTFSEDYYSLSSTYATAAPSGYAIIITYDPPITVYESESIDEFQTSTRRKAEKWLSEHGIDISRYTIYEKYHTNYH